MCFQLLQILLTGYIITEIIVVKCFEMFPAVTCIQNWEDTIQSGDVDHGNKICTPMEWVSFPPTWVALVYFLIFILSYLFKICQSMTAF